MDFNGAEYVEVPGDDSLDITDEITIGMWVKVDNPGTGNFMFSKYAGESDASYELYHNPSGSGNA